MKPTHGGEHQAWTTRIDPEAHELLPARPSCGFSFLCGLGHLCKKWLPLPLSASTWTGVGHLCRGTSRWKWRTTSTGFLQLLVLPVNNNLQFPRTLAHWQHDLQRRCNGYRLNWRQAFVLYGIAATVWFDKEQSGSQKDRWTNMCHGAFFAAVCRTRRQGFFRFRLPCSLWWPKEKFWLYWAWSASLCFESGRTRPLCRFSRHALPSERWARICRATWMTQCVPSTALVVPGGWAAAVCSFTFVLGHVPALPCAAATDRIMTSGSCQPSATSRPRWWTRWSFLAAHTAWLAMPAPSQPGAGACKLKSWKHAEGFWEVITSTFVLLS